MQSWERCESIRQEVAGLKRPRQLCRRKAGRQTRGGGVGNRGRVLSFSSPVGAALGKCPLQTWPCPPRRPPALRLLSCRHSLCFPLTGSYEHEGDLFIWGAFLSPAAPPCSLYSGISPESPGDLRPTNASSTDNTSLVHGGVLLGAPWTRRRHQRLGNPVPRRMLGVQPPSPSRSWAAQACLSPCPGYAPATWAAPSPGRGPAAHFPAGLGSLHKRSLCRECGPPPRTPEDPVSQQGCGCCAQASSQNTRPALTLVTGARTWARLAHSRVQAEGKREDLVTCLKLTSGC